MRRIKRMTPKRRAYLENLLDGPKPRHGRGGTGYDLMQFGWTEWDFRYEGKPISGDEWRELVRSGVATTPNFDERITPAGRTALQEGGRDE